GRHPAHGGPQGGEEDPRHQQRPAGAPHAQRGLHRDRRPEGDRARDLSGDKETAIGALVLAVAVSIALFSRRALFLYRLLPPARPRAEAAAVLGQRKLLQRLVPGLMHAAIFWGFLVLFPTIVIAMIGAVDAHSTVPWLGSQGWYALLVDAFALMVLAGVVTAL